MGANSLPKTVTRQHRGCDLNPGPSAPESSTLTTRLPCRPVQQKNKKSLWRWWVCWVCACCVVAVLSSVFCAIFCALTSRIWDLELTLFYWTVLVTCSFRTSRTGTVVSLLQPSLFYSFCSQHRKTHLADSRNTFPLHFCLYITLIFFPSSFAPFRTKIFLK